MVERQSTDLQPPSAEVIKPQSAPQVEDKPLPAKHGEAAGGGQDLSLILTGKKLAFVFISMMLAVLLVSLDQTILATALPRIASDFNSFDKQGWISSAFLLTNASFVLVFGQILRIYPAKFVLISTTALFEVGSIICGSSNGPIQLIFGRAIAGVGAAGIFTAMLQTLAQVTRLEDRPRLFACFGVIFALASVIGPLIGGALTDHASWRWCFYINLPVGAVTLVACTLLLKPAPPLGADLSDRSARSLLRQTGQLDWVGAVLALGGVSSLALALQWGGNQKPWDDGAVIACFVVAGVVATILVFWERYLGEKAMTPVSVFSHGATIYAILANGFFGRFALPLLSYYVPVFFQAARHHDATQSGVDLLAFMLATVISIIISGRLVAYFGRYWHILVLGPIPGAIGGGLLYTVTPSTSTATVIGFQILCGVGVGSVMQHALFACQATFKATPRLISQASALVQFFQLLGGTIALAIGQAALSTQLKENFAEYAPTAPLETIEQSPLAIWDLPESEREGAVKAYVKSLNVVWVVVVPIYVLSMISALFIKDISIKPPAKKKEDEEKKLESEPVKKDAEEETTTAIKLEEKSVAPEMAARAEGAV
ncbi:hypothetical protein JCM8547_006303 [Rhodosporidiobolus lusitaniae]